MWHDMEVWHARDKQIREMEQWIGVYESGEAAAGSAIKPYGMSSCY
jgi:hypothetical protein